MRSGLAAEFTTGDDLLIAIQALQRRGYREIDAFTPHPVPGIGDVLGLGRSRLGFVVFAIGMAGAIGGFWLMWYCNAWSYPINVGGRPPFAIPAFIPITFESGVLAAGATAFIAFFWSAGMPSLTHPLFKVDGFERSSIDRFWLAIDAGDAALELARTTADLHAVGAVRVAPFGRLAS